MMRIGFIDNYLDEAHANSYPELISRLSGGKAAVVAAYGHKASPITGMSTKEWCEKMQITQCETREELVAASDCIVVLSPDSPEMHWELCQEALKSGKRVFVDKTFATEKKTAEALFTLAEQYHTPMYSASALYSAKELEELPEADAEFIAACGPGKQSNYLVHQFEPIVAVMKKKIRRISYLGTHQVHHFDLEFEDDKRACATLLGAGPFSMTIKYTDGTVSTINQMSDYFERSVVAMLQFFETGEGGVPKEQTITVSAIIEAGCLAMEKPGTWVDIENENTKGGSIGMPA